MGDDTPIANALFGNDHKQILGKNIDHRSPDATAHGHPGHDGGIYVMIDQV